MQFHCHLCAELTFSWVESIGFLPELWFFLKGSELRKKMWLYFPMCKCTCLIQINLQSVLVKWLLAEAYRNIAVCN